MLADLLAALDNRRAEFLTALDSIPADQRNRTPATNAWSPLQIGEHVFLVERGLGQITARQIEKGEDRRRVGEPSEKSVEGLLQAMRTPAKFKIPDGVRGIDPDGEMSYAKLREAWTHTGERWHEIARTLPPELEGEALVQHAVGGPMTTAQTIRFLEAHAEHHLHQLARTTRALSDVSA